MTYSLLRNGLAAAPNQVLKTTGWGSVVNADISAAAAIAYSKLALTGAILNADLAGSIAYAKLTLTNSIVNADIGSAAAIAYSKLNLATSILNADINAAAAIAISKLAPMANKTLFTSDGSTNAASASPTVSGSLTAEAGINAGTTGAATGEVKTSSHIKAGGSFYPGGQTTINTGIVSNATTVADNASITISATAFGVYIIINNSTGSQAMVFMASAANTVTEIKQTSTTFDINTGVDNNKVNIYHDGANYIVKNQTGSSQVLTVLRVLAA